ncbi:MAG TPA: hypothetical protein VD908_19520 [Cytophagales bacterium]|nr:hypothetical protein [Cytophagales bacterium]
MCNADNHPPGCMCGFGGEGHLGARGSSYNDLISRFLSADELLYKRLRDKIDPTNYDSYVNPNAICPVCGESVFFYQSEYGGRVFFDELGPPWPKHPCTDSNQIPELNLEPVEIDSEWQKNGWTPYELMNSSTLFGKLTIYGMLPEFIEDLDFAFTPLTIDINNDFIISPFRFYKELSPTKFEIIFYNLRTGKAELVKGEKDGNI